MPEVLGKYEHEGTSVVFFASENEQSSEPYVVKRTKIQKRENLNETFSSGDKSSAELVFKSWVVELIAQPEVKPGFLSKGLEYEPPQDRW